MKTSYQRWQERTKDGRRLAAGWTSAKHTPTTECECEVRGHPKRSMLTWAHDHWWYLHRADMWDIPYWHCEGDKRYTWKPGRWGCNASIHRADLLMKAVVLGSESAAAELRTMGWKGDYNPYAGPDADRSWLHR
jgi:hypothetical protein